MKTLNIYDELKSNSYPGRGIVIGKSADGKSAVTAYFIMGRSVNSRNRVFTETEDGIKTEAADPSKLSDPHLIIYSPVRVLGNKTIVTNGDHTPTLLTAWVILSTLTWVTAILCQALRASLRRWRYRTISRSSRASFGKHSTRTTRCRCL